MMSPHTEPHIPAPLVYGDTSVDMESLEREALSLKGQLSSANRDVTKKILGRLKELSGRMPTQGRRSRRFSGVISTAIVQAQQQLDWQVMDETVREDRDFMPVALQTAVYYGMSRAQQVFYHQIESKAEYNLAGVDASGRLDTTSETKVSGAQLRKHFSILKYHSLSEKEKKDLLNKTFGIDAPESDGAKTAAQLATEREELANVRQALVDMEAYKAYMLLSQSTDMRSTLARISRNRAAFAKAQSDIDALDAAYAELIASPNDEMLAAKLAVVRRNMKQTLKDGIVNGVLTEDENSQAEKQEYTLAAPGAIWRGTEPGRGRSP